MFKLPRDLLLNYIYSEYKPKKVSSSSNELIINSPFVTDTKYHCYINIDNSVFTDFKYGDSGSMFKFFKLLYGHKSCGETMSFLVKNYGNQQQKLDFEKENEIVDGNKIINDFLNNDKPKFFGREKELGLYGKMCLRYVVNRKINEDYISKMGYVFNDTSRYSGRIIIPYFENGQMVYFQARDINKESTLRYLNPEKLDTKEFVFNIDDITDELIIAEGPFDAMSMDEQEATCMDSGDLGEKQINKIFSKHPSTIIYCPDQDKTGFEHMNKNIEKLYRFCPYTSLKILIFNVPKPFKDLNEMKVGSGKNFILKKECSEYTKYNFGDFIVNQQDFAV